jgi:glycosyltransferase 2 family protein
MKLESQKILKTLNPNKVWVPVLFGLGIVFFMLYSDPELTTDKLRLIFDASWSWVLVALLVLVIRDAGYMYRNRMITDKELSWTSCLYVTILWEFASAVTPSVVGGTAVAVFIYLKEGLNLGKSLAYVLLSAILDNLFFVLTAPIALILAGGHIFPENLRIDSALGNNLKVLFFVSYGLIATYTLIMSYGLFIKPRAFKWFLLKVTSWRLLRRWRKGAYEHGNEIILASAQLTGKGAGYWTKIIVATIVIWSARYLLLNALIAGFTETNLLDNFIIFARQIIMWIVMLVSPTPGSSGTAEYFFNEFFYDFLGDHTLVNGILWRIMTYYPYLIAGAIFLPRWIKRVFFKKRELAAK